MAGEGASFLAMAASIEGDRERACRHYRDLLAARELPVESLPQEAAVELFVSRAVAAGRAVAPDDIVAAVCRRLDHLPLALELAAARAKLLSPAALLQRLDAALPLLTGGASDRPERQRTLRATIEWSYDLLDLAEQLAFRRLSVFRGSFTLDAAREICSAELEHVEALLDQSLLKPLGDARFFMLETLREYARECLEIAGEVGEFNMRHARHYMSVLEEMDRSVFTPELLPWFGAEEDNLRAMLDRLTVESPEDAGRACELISRYWLAQGANSEVLQRAGALLSSADLPPQIRAGLLIVAQLATFFRGEFGASAQFAEEAVHLAEPGTLRHAVALSGAASIAVQCGDLEAAVAYARHAAHAVDSLDEVRRWIVLIDAGEALALAGHFDEARAWTSKGRDGLRHAGSEIGAAVASDTLAFLDLADHNFEAARAAFASSIETAQRHEHPTLESLSLRGLGFALLGLGRRAEAFSTFVRWLELADGFDPPPNTEQIAALGAIGLSAAPPDAAAGAKLRGSVMRLRREVMEPSLPGMLEVEEMFERELADALGAESWAKHLSEGADLSFENALALARSLGP